jgi:hypothetical protein
MISSINAVIILIKNASFSLIVVLIDKIERPSNLDDPGFSTESYPDISLKRFLPRILLPEAG